MRRSLFWPGSDGCCWYCYCYYCYYCYYCCYCCYCYYCYYYYYYYYSPLQWWSVNTCIAAPLTPGGLQATCEK